MPSLLPNACSEFNTHVPFCGLRSGQLFWSLSSKTGQLVLPSLFLLKKCIYAYIYTHKFSLQGDKVYSGFREDGDDYEHGNLKWVHLTIDLQPSWVLAQYQIEEWGCF